MATHETKNKAGISQREAHWICVVILSSILAGCLLVVASMYQKIASVEVEDLVNTSGLEESHPGASDSLFVASFKAIHDPDFYQHRGYSLWRDMLNGVGRVIGRQVNHDTITRKVARQAGIEGRFAGFYKQYLIPVKLENELTKNELLEIYLQVIEDRAGISYARLSKVMFASSLQSLDIYELAVLHSVMQTRAAGITSAQQVETMFLNNLAKLYRHMSVDDRLFEQVYDRYEKEFANHLRQIQCQRAPEGGDMDVEWPQFLGGAMNYADLVYFYARKHEISFPLFLAMVQAESGGNPYAVSHANAYGLAQIILPTGRRVTGNPDLDRFDLFDPHLNLDTGARYIRLNKDRIDARYPHLSQSDRVDFIAASYNAGWHRVSRLDRVPNIAETKGYVATVHAYRRLYKQHLDLITDNIIRNSPQAVCLELQSEA